MKRLNTAALVLCLGLFMLVALATNARAEGFGLYDWGARGSGLANGMVGRADDVSAVAHNPAGLTQLPGTQMMIGSSIISPKMLIDTIDKSGNTTTSRVERHYYMVPHAFFSYQLNDRVWLGFGSFTRFGLGNQYPSNWPGAGNIQDVRLTTISFNPNLAFKVTDKLSLAIGLEAMTARMKMHKYTNVGLGNMYHEMSGKNTLGFGFNVAAHYKFNEQWAAGLTYRSAITQDVTGDSTFHGLPGMLTIAPGKNIPSSLLNGRVKGHLRLPDMISFGVTYKPMPNLSFEVGTVYTVWSRFRNFNLHLSGPVVNASSFTHKDWKDTWLINASVEYKPLDWLALRAGYSYETSPANAGTADYMVETNGRWRYSCGLGFMWDNWTVDLAYTLLRSHELDYHSSNASGVQPGKSRHGITHVGALSVGYKF